jgi:hypothetical protein
MVPTNVLTSGGHQRTDDYPNADALLIDPVRVLFHRGIADGSLRADLASAAVIAVFLDDAHLACVPPISYRGGSTRFGSEGLSLSASAGGAEHSCYLNTSTRPGSPCPISC